jgi:uncharacterized YccA/Bax inhibitor family protein
MEDQVRSSSNPAFRNLATRGNAGYAGFGSPQGYPQGGVPGYGADQAPPTSADRPITVDDVVMKTATTLGTVLLVGIIAAVVVLNDLSLAIPLAIGGGIVGFVLGLVNSFKREPSPPLIMLYAVAEGVFLGAITGVVQRFLPGVALQALLGTGLVFGVMLVVYKTGAVKVTPKLTKWIIGVTMGALALVLVNLVLWMFGVDMGIRSNGPLAIIFSLVMIGLAAFWLLLDFDQADQMIRQGLPAKFAWYAAFGLTMTLVWLYVEILRLLWILNSSD